MEAKITNSNTVVTDKGRNFVSDEFEEYMKQNGIYHFRKAHFHPSSNEKAERTVF